mgnify:CR=1 FL=1
MSQPNVQPTPGAHFEIKEKIAQLQSQLLSSHPLIPTLLRTIHTQLKADPEIVTLLEESEIKTIVTGLQHVTKVKLVEAAKPKKKSLKSLDVDDF